MATNEATTGEQMSERLSIAHQATGDIEALIGMMRREIATDADQLDVILDLALHRIKELNSVVMSAVGDDSGRDTEEMHRVVFGE